jgi:VanZ family protein
MELFTRKAWLLLSVTWAVIIFNLSRAPYSSGSSARFISLVLDWLSVSLLPENLGLLNNLLRKSAHLTEYAVLAVLLYNSLKPVGEHSCSRKAAVWALLASGSYSITDELHQLFVPGRHASLVDCLLDTTGAFLGLFLLFSCLAVWRKQTLNES